MDTAVRFVVLGLVMALVVIVAPRKVGAWVGERDVPEKVAYMVCVGYAFLASLVVFVIVGALFHGGR
jgi:hypothetical protein